MPKEMICDNCACSIHDDYSDDYFEAKKTISELLERVSSLTKERQEMVEALRTRLDGLEDYNNEYFFLEYLLSKFEP